MVGKKSTSENQTLLYPKICKGYQKKIHIKFSSSQRKKAFHINQKGKNNRLLHNLANRKSLLDLGIIIISIIIFLSMNSKIYCDDSNFIIITVNGGGSISILSSSYSNLPNRTQINDGELNESPTKEQTLDSGTHTIKMIWDYQLTTCKDMFKNLHHLISIDLRNFDFSLVDDMESFFEGCDSLKSIDLSGAIATNVWNMKLMFRGCSELISLNLQNFRTFELVYMSEMFYLCSKIISIDLSSFETPKLADLVATFRECKALKYLNLGNIQTSNVQRLFQTFQNCESLESLDLSNFNTEMVYDMNFMFEGCHSLISLNLSNFRTPALNAMGCMFNQCNKLETLDITNFNTAGVRYMNQVFDQCHSIKSLDLSHFNTRSAETMWHMFYNCYALEYLNVSNFNTEKIDNFESLFINCRSLKSLDLSSFNTAKVNNMNAMFYGCNALESVDISSFNTEAVTNMASMFSYCNAIKSLDLKHFETPKLTNMNAMFLDCFALEFLDVSTFNTSKVTDMSAAFQSCKVLESLNLGNFDTTSLVKMSHMFHNCKALKSLDLHNFYTPNLQYMNDIFSECDLLESVDISNFDTSKVSDMTGLFYNCFALKSLEIQNFDTSLVTSMAKMFRGCNQLTTLDITHFKTELVKDISQMFDQCHILTSLNISNFNTPLLENIYNIFYNCHSLTFLDISNLNTSKCQSFQSVFFNCSSLTTLNIANFDTTLATNMNTMFKSCKKLESLDLSNFYTPNLQTANELFNECLALKWVNISNLDTSKLTNFNHLFLNCQALTSLDISNFDTKSATTMAHLFHNCYALTSLNISNFDTSNVENIGQMFDQCHSLTSLDLSNFNTTKVTNIYNMFYNCYSLQYLDVSSFNTEKINNMNNLFIYSRSLKSLNLSSFTIYDTTLVDSILGNTFSEIVLCYNESKMPEHFIAQVRYYENSCQKLCIMNSRKFILDIEMCVDNCYSETEYKYEYEGICYKECPIRTQLKNDSTYLCEDCPNFLDYEQIRCIDTVPEGYYNNDTSAKTIDKCPNKCESCSLESLSNNNLCKACNNNDNFYSKDNDPLNINSFYECYHKDEIQIGYYLDTTNNIFKACGEKCRTCSYDSIVNNNNLCTSCNLEENYYPKSDESSNQIYECYNKNEEQVGYYLDTANNIFKPCDRKCKTCSYDSIQNNNLCTECNLDGNYYPKSDESLGEPYFECYHKDNEQVGYYLDTVDNILKPCNEKCRTCTLESFKNGNLCTSCNTESNYYPKSEDISNSQIYECYHKDIEQIGYYFDNSYNIFKKCDEKCRTCSYDSIINNDNLCTSCNLDENYYPKSDESSNQIYECYNKNEEQIGYYLDTTNNIFKKCDEKCRTCSYESIQNNNLCTECNLDGNYYPKSDESLGEPYFECYHKDNEQVGYYLDTVDNILKPCNEKCRTCTLESFNNGNLCTSCNTESNYYPKSEDISNSQIYECYHKDNEQVGYYLDTTNNILKKCDEKCRTCSLESFENGNLCTSCNIDETYYPKSEDILNNQIYECYHKDNEQVGYYLDTNNNIFKKCDEKCRTCSLESFENGNLCTSCNIDENYYPKSEDMSNYECYHKDNEQVGYYFDNSYNIFKKCDEKCRTCSLESFENGNLCTSCNIDENYYPKSEDILNNQIYECYHKDNEQVGYYLDTTNHILKKCDEKCRTCSLESFENDNLCTSCNIESDYYPKYSDTFNEDSFYECYHKDEEQIGFYLDTDNNIFKPCYSKCKTCNNEGDDTNNNCDECKQDHDYILENGNCIERELVTSNITQKYDHKISYDINSYSEEAKNNFSNTYIDISQETIEFLKKKYNLKDEDKIFVTIYEDTKNNSGKATSDYIYEYYLENGTILNLSDIEEDVYVDVYVPIKDLETAKFDLLEEYAAQGYDIYDKNSEFYTDFCTPASFGDNDITLADRKKDIYPQNVTLCKSNCKYNGINIEEQRVICSCNLNSDKNEEDEFAQEDDGNFATYLLDNINYKIFMCYKLFFNFNNLKESYPFYIILAIFLFFQIFNFIYICHTLEKLKILMMRGLSSNKKLINALNKKNENGNTHKKANPAKKKKNITRNSIKRKSVVSKDINNRSKSENKILICVLNNKNEVDSHTNVDLLKSNQNKRKSLNKIKNDHIYETLEANEVSNMNELPFSKAVHVDKRNVFYVFYTLIIEKLELISIFCSDSKIKVILFIEYVLSLLINFFFNSLLYTDDVISNKYHNNGELDIIVTLTLSIVSNIVTSIFCYYTKYSRGIDERINLISEIRYNKSFYRNTKKFILFLRIKFVCFFMCQIVILATCMYYIVIFCILYKRSQESLIVNYCYSLVESLITSFGITLIIIITRKIGLSCMNKELYNVSKFINAKF